jgi:hypothetical protein
MDASTIVNPNGVQTVFGIAADGTGVAAVEDAVQSSGPDGACWDDSLEPEWRCCEAKIGDAPIVGVAAVRGVAVIDTESGVVGASRAYVDLDVWKYRGAPRSRVRPSWSMRPSTSQPATAPSMFH